LIGAKIRGQIAKAVGIAGRGRNTKKRQKAAPRLDADYRGRK
jgi:hypothetical protein